MDSTGYKGIEVEQEDINDADENDAEDLNFADQENQKLILEVKSIVKTVSYPSLNQDFLRDFNIDASFLYDNDGINREIIYGLK